MFEIFWEFVKSNSFLSGGAVLGTIGFLIAYLRSLPGTIWAWCKRRIIIEIDIPDRDETFKWLDEWLTRQRYQKRCRLLTVCVSRKRKNRYDTAESDTDYRARPEIRMSPAPGVHYFFYKNRFIILRRDRKDGADQKSSIVLGYRETFNIKIFSRNRQLVLDLLEEAREIAHPASDDRIAVYLPSYGDWLRASKKLPRPIESVILAEGLAEKMLSTVKEFQGAEEWYNELGIPYRLGCLLYGPPGNGKCLGKGTEILMYNGAIKLVEDIQVGDLLMGPDSKSRKVLSTTNGHDLLYKIKPVKGNSYVVNSNHILSLKMSSSRDFKNKVVNVSVKDYLQKSNWFKEKAKGYRVGIEFEKNYVLLDPYFLGVWLGDGTRGKCEITTDDLEISIYLYDFAKKNNLIIKQDGKRGMRHRLCFGPQGGRGLPKFRHPINKILRQYGILNIKRIPQEYKINSREVRLAVLAGLIDSDGSYNNNCYDFITKYEELADDVVFLARSLGYAAYKSLSWKVCFNSKNPIKKSYYRVSISGSMEEIPVKLTRKKCTKRTQKKDVLVTGIQVKSYGEGEYFGFTLDNDGLFLLSDFTVTHNSSLVMAVASMLRLDICVLNLSSSGLSDDRLTELMTNIPGDSILLIEDIDCIFNNREKSDDKDTVTFSGLLNAIDGVMAAEGRVLFLTTNHIDKLDPALIRPGRCDMRIEIGHATPKQAEKLFLRFFPESSLAKEFGALIKDGISMASIQGHLLNYRKNANECLTKWNEMV